MNLERRLERLERASPEPGDKGPSVLDYEVAGCVANLLACFGPPPLLSGC